VEQPNHFSSLNFQQHSSHIMTVTAALRKRLIKRAFARLARSREQLRLQTLFHVSSACALLLSADSTGST